MFRRIAGVAIAAAGVAAAVLAQQPAAAKKHVYEITPEAGAWAVSVACFFENFDQSANDSSQLETVKARCRARTLAINLVTTLRRDYKLPAYMYYRGDEDLQKEDARAVAYWKQLEKLKGDLRQRGVDTEISQGRTTGSIPGNGEAKVWNKRYCHIQLQFAVLIGGYPDQATARRALDTIRNLPQPPDEFCNKELALQGDRNTGYKTIERLANPFKTAMVVPNPTGPKIKPPADEAADWAYVLEQANINNPYSPLRHPGKWTLVVKQYQALTRMVGLEDRDGGKRTTVAKDPVKMFDAITKASEQLAAILRNPALNFDAYVLHTNHESLVTVGLFDSETDPRLISTQANLAKLRLQVTGGGSGMEQLNSPALPIQIPRAK
jgi:hypothetical protein